MKTHSAALQNVFKTLIKLVIKNTRDLFLNSWLHMFSISHEIFAKGYCSSNLYNSVVDTFFSVQIVIFIFFNLILSLVLFLCR